MGMEQPTGCTFTSLKSLSMLKLETVQHRLSNVKSIVSSETRALRTQNITPVITVNGSLLRKSVAHVIVGTHRYLREVPKLIKIGFNAWRSSTSSYEVVQGMQVSYINYGVLFLIQSNFYSNCILFLIAESYSCLLRLKSLAEEDALRVQPGSGEARVLYVHSLLSVFGFAEFD